MSRFVFVLIGFVFFGSTAAHSESPYIKTSLVKGVLNVVVLGDSLANGLHQGLTQLNKDRDDIKTIRKSKVNTGLVRRDRYDWNKAAKQFAHSGKYQAAVVLLGLNDMQTIREKGKAHHFKTDGWRSRYMARAEAMMRDLKSGGLAVYWVSNPIVTEKHHQEEIFYLNGIYSEVAAKVGVRFIDTWKPLGTEDGKYTPFYTGADGKKQQIRHRDGVHFTSDGYLIFANFVNHIMLQDLQRAHPKEKTKEKTEELGTP
ncbi:MAG: DUF459 domain-containing protein [Rhizobiaceae bacterium]